MSETLPVLLGGLVLFFLSIFRLSSSATVGMALVLAKQDLLTLAGGMALMLGAELGTCSNTLLATINGSRQAIKAGLFHLVFNLLTIIIGLLLFDPFVQLIDWLSAGQPVDNALANAHVLFSVGGVLLYLPFVRPTGRLLNYLLPDREDMASLSSE